MSSLGVTGGVVLGLAFAAVAASALRPHPPFSSGLDLDAGECVVAHINGFALTRTDAMVIATLVSPPQAGDENIRQFALHAAIAAVHSGEHLANRDYRRWLTEYRRLSTVAVESGRVTSLRQAVSGWASTVTLEAGLCMPSN